LEHAANVKLLFFNGVEDLICNHVGNEVMLEKLPWKHQDDWIKAERFAWRAESEQVSRISGYVKEFENLSFLKGNYDK
jgi:carboxypeptidase C (cathepsin A)